GIPLAIELAAARLNVLTLAQIAERLADRFRLLTGGKPAALPRHRTLRALVDWSYELMREPERVLLRRLAVFAGGCTLEAVEAICTGDGLEPAAVLDVLSQLVDHSVVVAEEGLVGMRYRLLETIREYGSEQLHAAGEDTALHDRHLAWY